MTAQVVDAATEIAARHHRPVPQIALAWLLGTPGITAPIIGTRTLTQLEDLLRATDITLDDTERTSLKTPAPPPEISPQRVLRDQLNLPDILPIRRAATTDRSHTPA